ncbi:MAG: polysaccharide deacetylase family protein [Methanoregula sp.]|nr:polysaccharide deacetylase family protein [Methanoregula sp.]
MINVSNLLKIGIHDPAQLVYRLEGKFKPDLLFKRYGKLAQKQGFDRLYVILSFDCDSPEDIPAAKIIHSYLKKNGLKGTFAVPGHLLKEGAEVYRSLSDGGADFINHGALPHVEKRGGRYWSTTFYNDMPVGEVIRDIKEGHKIYNSVIGHPPIGFRAPHFGTIQNPLLIKSIYNVLQELKYLYSSSTMPISGFRFGPVQTINGLYEISLSGSYFEPLEILDSWNNIISPYNPIVKNEYAFQFIQTIEHLMKLNVSGVLNYYVDPAHVVSSRSFYEAIDFLIQQEIPTLYYDDAIKLREGS